MRKPIGVNPYGMEKGNNVTRPAVPASRREAEQASSIADSKHTYLLQFWDVLAYEERAQLLEHVAAIDFDQIAELYNASPESYCTEQTAHSAIGPKRLIGANIRDEQPDEFKRAVKTGWDALRDGRVGVVLVAGGEGSRLGFPHPKGQFPIGPVSKKSLYQMLAEQLVAISRRAQATIPYYVMTSDATHSETVQFFEDHQYFGLDPSSVSFFQQGRMPAVDQKTGQVLMSEKHSVALSPDGHGGLLEAMRTAQLFDDLRDRRIEVLFYHQVDNPLVKVCDPAFLGFHLLQRSDVSTKVVAKEDPSEKVGLLVEVDDRHRIIEYTDLPAELAKERDSSGLLKLRCGNIAVHLFDTRFLERMANDRQNLPYHRSSKKVSYVDESGQLRHPNENNAYKFERFIFDILPRAERPLAMEVIREQEFMPLKNAEGQFSAEYVKKGLCRLHTGWLKRVGWTNEEELPIEIPPSAGLDEEDFASRLAALANNDKPPGGIQR